MDAKRFLAKFRHIASAPAGVQRLRGLILQLAISGDLTDRIVDDTVASALFAANIDEQEQLIAEGHLKPLHAPKKMTEGDQPWRLPDGWMWCRLGEVTSYGHALKAEFEDVDDQTWVLELEDIEKSTSRLLHRVLARDRKFKSTKNRFGKGSVLYGKLRPYLDKVLIADAEGVCTTEIAPISFFGNIEPGYLRWYLKSPFFIAYATNATHGMNLPRVGTDKVRNAPFPFPPAQEQVHIVAKVDELMALCDKLETQQQEREALCKLTCKSVFQTLASAKIPSDLQAAWKRAEANTSLLLDTPEGIQSYRGAILDLAMSGLLLASENRAVLTGSALLIEIARRRAAWAMTAEGQELKEAVLMENKVRTQRVVTPDQDIPKHWAWGSVLQIAQVVVDCHNKTAPYVLDGIHLVRTSDIRHRHMDLKHTKKISPDTYAYWARRLLPKAGDLFFTREAPMGEAAIVPEGEKVCLGQRTMLIRLFPELFNNRFLLYAIYSPSFQERMVKAAIGMTVKHLRVGGVEDLMVPVPPKAEQDRIVAIVDALFYYCDQLETQLSHKRDTASNLAKASVEAITGIRIEDKKKMKAPKTELVSTLCIGVSSPNGGQAPLATILTRNNGEMSAKTLWTTSGLEIDAFYQQLRTEMAQGWIAQPEMAYMKEVEAS